jgi:hypothetical protein
MFVKKCCNIEIGKEDLPDEVAGSSGRCDPEEIFSAVVPDDGLAQARDGEILGFDMDGESEFSGCLNGQ